MISTDLRCFRSTVDHQADKQLIGKLQAESRGARDIRAKLSQSLATVRKAEIDLRSKYTSFRTGLRRNNISVCLHSSGALEAFITTIQMLHGWSLWTLITVQVVLALVMYR
jgi:hypothetical protein